MAEIHRRGVLLGGLGCALGVASLTAAAPGGTPALYGDPQAPLAGRVLGTVVRTRDADELRCVALRVPSATECSASSSRRGRP